MNFRSPHSLYERNSYNARDFQSRFSTDENIEGFGFHSNNGNDFELGFGTDDLFLDHRDVSTRERISPNYEDGKVSIFSILLYHILSFRLLSIPGLCRP